MSCQTEDRAGTVPRRLRNSCWLEGVAEGGSPAREGFDDTGAIGLVVVIDTEVGVRGVGAEDGEGGAQGGLAAMEAHGGDAEGRSGATWQRLSRWRNQRA